MADDANQTIVIKKINKGGHAAHGGAWKVAYADFVTAMMAFFLLLWLLNATEAEKLAGLADYFAPTVGVAGNMGIGFRGGAGALSKGIGADKSTNHGIIFAAPVAGTVVKNPEIVENENDLVEQEKIEIVEQITPDSEEEAFDEEAFQAVEEALAKELASKELEDVKDNINVEITPEGLKIQISDTEEKPMFAEGSAVPSESAKKILSKISQIITLLPNYVSIIGHTYSLPLGRGVNYTNWELSADRANSARRNLIDNGVVKEQISRVVGKADHDPVDPQNPELLKNNRIEVILLRGAFLSPHKKGAPDEVFVNPDAATDEDLISVEVEKEEEEVIEEVIEPETKGRDFFQGVEGEGIEYDASDPSDGEETVVPNKFFTKEAPGADIFSNKNLFGDDRISEEGRPADTEKEDAEPLSDAEKKKKFFEEDLQQLPPPSEETPEDLLNGGESSFPTDFFGGLGL